VNPDYDGVYVFDNEHPCVGPDAPGDPDQPPPPYASRRANGVARVICYTPRHDLTLAQMVVPDIARIVETWRRQTRDLGTRPQVKQVLIFENKGEVVGVSNPHPHGQIYATNFTWKTFDTELEAQRRYARETGRALFADIIDAERRDGRRVLCEDEYAIAFVPYFARYAYEVYVAPRRRVPHISALSDAECESLAAVLKNVTVRYDNLFRCSYPYSMGWHGRPHDGGEHPYWRLHGVAFPPLLRSATVRKFLVGFELAAEPQRDLTAEAAAARLRELPEEHYRRHA